MKTQNFLIIVILILPLPHFLLGQSYLARINDVDGFTYLRNEATINSAIVDTIFENELFYSNETNSEWLKVSQIGFNIPNYQRVGYMHFSRVQYIKDLNAMDKKDLITSVFTKHNDFDIELFEARTKRNNDFEGFWKSKEDSLYFEEILEKYISYKIEYFEPVLNIFPDYFCKTRDTSMLKLFINTIWANRGSASELPSLAIGECFICEPVLVKEAILPLFPGKFNLMVDHIDWGLKNLFWTKEDGINDPSSKEYEDYIKRLEAIKDLR